MLYPRAVVAQKLRELLNYKPSVYRELYDNTKVIFVHIPKCAGTSIAHTLYGTHTWHWKSSELRFINRQKFDSYFRFSIVRNPWDRLYSTYKYAPLDAEKFNKSPIAFIQRYASFEEFIMTGLTKELVSSNYFLGTALSFLKIKNNFAVNTIGYFEDLEAFVQKNLLKVPQFTGGIPIMNCSTEKKALCDIYTTQMIERVAEMYAEDISAFGYDFDSRPKGNIPKIV